jgi:uncharacterized protein YutD
MTSVGPVAPVIYPHIYNVKHDDDPDYRGTAVKQIAVDKIMVNNHTYQLVYDYRDGFDPERFGQRFETILNKYDYIVGDWGFEQLRLRGFYKEHNRTANRDQIITTLDDYIMEFCNFGCAFFVLQREGGPAKNTNKRHNPDVNQNNRENRHRNHHSNNKSNNEHNQHRETKAATTSQPTTTQRQSQKTPTVRDSPNATRPRRRNNRRKSNSSASSAPSNTATRQHQSTTKQQQLTNQRSSQPTEVKTNTTKKAKSHPFRIRHVDEHKS